MLVIVSKFPLLGFTRQTNSSAEAMLWLARELGEKTNSKLT